MRKYLVCSLNDENYTQADYDFCNTFEEAKEKCIENVAEYYEISNKEAKLYMKFIYDGDSNNHFYNYQDEYSFFVNQIIEIDVDKEDYLCVWHHAYNGVNFDLTKVGSDKECSDIMYKESAEIFKAYGMEISIDSSQVIVDTGEEWEVWDVIKVKEMVV